MIATLVWAAVRTVAIDSLAAFGALCAGGIVIAVTWAFLMRHRRAEHKNTRGYL